MLLTFGTEDALSNESFAGVKELTTHIDEYLAERNLAPKRYVWNTKVPISLGD